MKIHIVQNITYQANARPFASSLKIEVLFKLPLVYWQLLKSLSYKIIIAHSSENYRNFDGNHIRQSKFPQISLLQKKENKEDLSI